MSKRDEKGKFLRKEIPREDFLATNFPRSEEMFFAIDTERTKSILKAAFNEGSRRALVKEQEAIAEVKDAFANGDVATVRKHFSEQAKKLEKRYEDEDEEQRKTRERALKEIGKAEKTLAQLERHRLGSRGSERDADDLAIIHTREDLQNAKNRFEDAGRRLGAGHSDLDKLREFVTILDREIEKRGKRAAA